MEKVLRYEYVKGERFIYPEHKMVSNWRFGDNEEAEANLAHAIAIVAEKNGISSNEVMHLYPAILRMLKTSNNWSK